MNPYEASSNQHWNTKSLEGCGRSDDAMRRENLNKTSRRFILLSPLLGPFLLGLIWISFPTPAPGPWPYGQPTLLVEKLVSIAVIGHIVLSLAALVYSFWGITRLDLRTAFWLLVMITAPAFLLWAFELSMSKSGKWL